MPNPIRRGTQGTTLPLSNAPDAAVETNASSLNALTASIQSHDLEAVGRLLKGVVLNAEQANALLKACCDEIRKDVAAVSMLALYEAFGFKVLTQPSNLNATLLQERACKSRLKASANNSEDQAVATTQRIHAVFKAVLIKALADNSKHHAFPEHWLASEVQECIYQYEYSALGEAFSAFDPRPSNPSSFALLGGADRDLRPLIEQHLNPLERAHFYSLTKADIPGFYERVTSLTLDGSADPLEEGRLRQAVESLAKMPKLTRLKLANWRDPSRFKSDNWSDPIGRHSPEEVSSALKSMPDEVKRRITDLEFVCVPLTLVQVLAQFPNLKRLTLSAVFLSAGQLSELINQLDDTVKKGMLALRISGMALAVKRDYLDGTQLSYATLNLKEFESLVVLELSEAVNCGDEQMRADCNDLNDMTNEAVLKDLVAQLPNKNLLKELNLAASPFNTVDLEPYENLEGLNLDADRASDNLTLCASLVLGTISDGARRSVKCLNLTRYQLPSADSFLTTQYPQDLSGYSVLSKLTIEDSAAALIETLPAETREHCVINAPLGR